MKSIMGVAESAIYRNTGELVDALDQYIHNGGAIEQGVVFIPYKCKPELIDGDAIFRFVEETPDAIYFEFESTVS